MPKITYTDSSGTARTVEAELGSTVMETAIRNNIPGIEAECGGACACATCHVYVDEAWREKVGGPSPMEDDRGGERGRFRHGAALVSRARGAVESRMLGCAA